jgi:hypothetical protein
MILKNGKYSWENSAGIKMKLKYKENFEYNHKIQGGFDFDCEQEPYYSFIWTMKELGCKFDYLFPYFDDTYKSTNTRISENSKDIGIHMWYLRNWNESFDVWGDPNNIRYEKIENYL